MRNNYLWILSLLCFNATATSGGEVVTRHPSGLPATISALEHEIITSDSKGESCEAPVLMQHADDQASRIRAQYIWLDAVHPAYKLVERATRSNQDMNSTNIDIDKLKVFSWFKLNTKSAGTVEVCFDVSEAAVPKIKAIMDAQKNSKQSSDAELGDWMTYVKSVGIPSTVELCGAVLGNKERLGALASAWLVSHEPELKRGLVVAQSGLKSGQTIEEFNAAMVADFQKSFSGKPDDFKHTFCSDYLKSLEKAP